MSVAFAWGVAWGVVVGKNHRSEGRLSTLPQYLEPARPQEKNTAREFQEFKGGEVSYEPGSIPQYIAAEGEVGGLRVPTLSTPEDLVFAAKTMPFLAESWIHPSTGLLQFDVLLTWQLYREVYQRDPTPYEIEFLRLRLLHTGLILNLKEAINAMSSQEWQDKLTEVRERSAKGDINVYAEVWYLRELVLSDHYQEKGGQGGGYNLVAKSESLAALDAIIAGWYQSQARRLLEGEDADTILLSEDEAVAAMRPLLDEVAKQLREVKRFTDVEVERVLERLRIGVRNAYRAAYEIANQSGAVPTKRLLVDVFRRLLEQRGGHSDD